MKTSFYSKCVAHRANTVDQKEKTLLNRLIIVRNILADGLITSKSASAV